jgi:hypothetical protein
LLLAFVDFRKLSSFNNKRNNHQEGVRYGILMQIDREEKTVYISIKQTQDFCGWPADKIRTACKNGFLKAKTIKSGRGTRYMIDFFSLNTALLFKTRNPFSNEARTANANAIQYALLKQWQRRHVDDRIKIINETENLKGENLKSWCKRKKLRGFSYQSICRLRTAWLRSGKSIVSLIPKWVTPGANKNPQ